jgi:hypothetical protein
VKPPVKSDIAPRPIERALKKIPAGVTGLQRAILANQIAQGHEVPLSKVKDNELTGLQRAIAANVAAAKKS